jgi:hypothetical protein
MLQSRARSTGFQPLHSCHRNARVKNPCYFLIAVLFVAPAFAQSWSDRVRGSWVADENDANGVVLATKDSICDIVVDPKEESNVHVAAGFLQADIEKITGQKPAIVPKPRENHAVINNSTAPHGNEDDTKWSYSFSHGDWEAFQVRSVQGGVYLTGSNPRGTAFAVYTLSERLGIDPLYLWTGYTPEHHEKLVMKETNYSSGPPTVKYRGMFHDDEDILPRPFENAGYPYRFGDVPTEWYKKYFETALRLKFNMVAPYTRVHRRYEVQKLASDWGLFYTSHHYDILLSNPFGMTRYGLAEQRQSGTNWNWQENREGLLRYWRGGVDENKDINCIWPVGLRGTDDAGYKFAPGTTEAQEGQVFKEAIDQQVAMVKAMVPKDKQPPLFHFTLYTEMLPKFLSGHLDVPDDVMIIWPDDNDGNMRGLPTPGNRGKWKHGVYYHLAYLGKPVKQNASTVPPERIATEFKKIVDSGATEYMLVNVSELREFVREARMISDICWDAKGTLDQPNGGERFMKWFSSEYFGSDSAPYADYYKALDTYDKQWYAAERFHSLIEHLSSRFTGEKLPPIPEVKDDLKKREALYESIMPTFESAKAKMPYPQQQFFFDSLMLPLLFDYRPTQAALKLCDAMNEPDDAKAFKLCEEAMKPLERLEVEILRAEHPPFENWYRKTWIRRETKNWNVHRSYEELRMFLTTRGAGKLIDPEPKKIRPTTFTNAPTTAPTSR